MNATEMKKYLVAFEKTLDNVDKDEFYGTARDEWVNIYPQFLSWYNSHHNRVVAKEHRQNKTLNVTLTVEEADAIIQTIEHGLRGDMVRRHKPDFYREIIAKIQETEVYLRHAGVIT